MESNLAKIFSCTDTEITGWKIIAYSTFLNSKHKKSRWRSKSVFDTFYLDDESSCVQFEISTLIVFQRIAISSVMQCNVKEPGKTINHCIRWAGIMRRNCITIFVAKWEVLLMFLFSLFTKYPSWPMRWNTRSSKMKVLLLASLTCLLSAEEDLSQVQYGLHCFGCGMIVVVYFSHIDDFINMFAILKCNVSTYF